MRPSKDVLYLLQRSGLMASPKSVDQQPFTGTVTLFLQRFAPNHISRLSVSSPLSTRPALGSFTPISAHGRGEPNLVYDIQPLPKRHQERGMDLVEVLSFLFMLSTMELGRVRLPTPDGADRSYGTDLVIPGILDSRGYERHAERRTDPKCHAE
jgi:hypothetical protein